MQQRPPSFSSPLQHKPASRPRMQRKTVHDQVEPHPGREAEDGPLTQQYRAKQRLGVRNLQQLDLCRAFTPAVDSFGVNGMLLGQWLRRFTPVFGGMVDGAGPGKE